MRPTPGLPRYPPRSDQRLHGPEGQDRFLGAGVTQTVSGEPFLARLQTVDLHGVRAIRLRHTPVWVDHRLSRNAELPPGMLLAGTHRRGSVTAQQLGAPVLIQPGELSIIRSDRPFRYLAERNVDFSYLMFPVSMLGPAAERFLAARPSLRAATPLGTSTAAYLTRLVHLMLATPPPPPPPPRIRVNEAVAAGLALLRSVLAEAGAKDPATLPTAHEHLKLLALTVIEDEHRDPNLNVSGIAAALPVSPRQLQRAFSANDHGPAQILNRRRAETAAQALRDPALTVSAAAQLAGFRSESTMRHQFRARYGISPTESRTMAAGSGSWHDGEEPNPATVAR